MYIVLVFSIQKGVVKVALIISPQQLLWIALFSSVPIFVKLRNKTISSVRKFVIWGLPEHSLSQGDLSYELFMLNWCNKLTDVITSLAYIIINDEQNVGHTNM